MNCLKRVKHWLMISLMLMINLLIMQHARAALPISQVSLESGAKLYFIEVRSIPMVDIGIDFKAGSVYDPSGKSGVSQFVAAMMNKGSVIDAVQRSEAWIADQLSDRGASVSFSAGSESASMRLRSLSRSDVLNPLISQVSQMLVAPTFDSKILEREKLRGIAAIKEANSKPETILATQFDKMVYGTHPLGTETTEDSVQAIKALDLKKFHQTFYRAANANVLIVGDLSKDQAIAIANQLTQKLAVNSISVGAPQEIPLVSPLKALPADQREIRLAHPSQQAHIRVGALGIPRNHPDYFPLLVGNYILGGGGFVSRLMNEVREKRGLSYSVSSYFYPLKTSGLFIAGLQTKKDQANQALDVMRQTMAEFIQNGPTADELKAAKDNLINGFALRIDSNRKLMDNLSGIAWHGLPLNTLDEWTNQVSVVTQTQVQEALRKHLDMNLMRTVIVGAQ